MTVTPARRIQTLRRRQKLSELIVEDVKRRIVTEKLRPGDRLPGEAELIAEHGCAKATVREALKGLEVEGLVVREYLKLPQLRRS